MLFCTPVYDLALFHACDVQDHYCACIYVRMIVQDHYCACIYMCMIVQDHYCACIYVRMIVQDHYNLNAYYVQDHCSGHAVQNVRTLKITTTHPFVQLSKIKGMN